MRRLGRGPLFTIAATTTLLVGCAGSDDDDLNPVRVTLAYCAGEAPLWVAQQDGGDGSWRTIDASGPNTWNLEFNQPLGGIALVFEGQPLQLAMGASAELGTLLSHQVVNCGAQPGVISVNVAGIPEGTTGSASLAGRAAPLHNGLNELPQSGDGPHPLVAYRSEIDPDGSTRPMAFIYRRGVNVPSGGMLTPPIDFNSVEAFPAATAYVVVDGIAAGEKGEVRTELLPEGWALHGSVLPSQLGFLYPLSTTSNSREYGALPRVHLQNEWQALYTLVHPVPTPPAVYRGGIIYFRTPANQVIPLGPLLAQGTVTLASASPLRPRLTLPVQPEYNLELVGTFKQPPSARAVSFRITSNYRESPDEWVVTVPDFSLLPGWDQAWGLDPSAEVQASYVAYGGVFSPHNEGDLTRFAKGVAP